MIFLFFNQCANFNSLKSKLAHKERFKGAGGGKMKIDHKSDMCNWMWYKSDLAATLKCFTDVT